MDNGTLMVRAFAAFELSPEMKEHLAAAQAVLRKSTARLTFVDPGIIHITAKFLGEVDEKKVPRVIAALGSVKSTPFPVKGGRITVNNPRRPHTVWCAIDDGGKAGEVVSAMEAVLAPLGFPRETRPFTCHATLARVKEADPSLFSCLEALKDHSCGACEISGFKLKKSTLTPRGPVYGDLCEVAW
ncbi:RNA 2',3'-cyclic phosphodiesterase [Methanoregula sp.]|uniref:RNA 2',3'-cyclic phosphodiesterase n=1 Tax=Methanoregula sp. TaxID=2052170 RepID=UPI002C61CFE1|nr:RNA 2',3'-cyclic phosphodiesterase [Methanoregula sp.]HVP96614.1 RNA 2',3'-cyclic phosphodiesterase [Methanoregula sp.]